jgi:hypothetical protein
MIPIRFVREKMHHPIEREPIKALEMSTERVRGYGPFDYCNPMRGLPLSWRRALDQACDYEPLQYPSNSPETDGLTFAGLPLEPPTT